MEKHPPPKQSGENFFYPDMEFFFSGSAQERTALGLGEGISKVRLGSLDAKYFLILLVAEGHAENSQAMEAMDAARKELECCTPDVAYLAVGYGMSRREAMHFHERNRSGFPVLADPLEQASELAEETDLPAVFMLARKDNGFTPMFICGDLVSGPAPLVKRFNDALSGKPGRKCVRKK
ncbi:hypothetical protein N7E73_06725 [Maridesulfovibrio sp. FT414]